MRQTLNGNRSNVVAYVFLGIALLVTLGIGLNAVTDKATKNATKGSARTAAASAVKQSVFYVITNQRKGCEASKIDQGLQADSWDAEAASWAGARTVRQVTADNPNADPVERAAAVQAVATYTISVNADRATANRFRLRSTRDCKKQYPFPSAKDAK